MEFDYQKISAPNFVKKIDQTGAQLLDYIGWTFAHESGILIDNEKQIIPWYNYTVVKFIQERLPKDACVFEYGSGFSTLFYAKRVREIISVEVNEDCALWISESCAKLEITNSNVLLKNNEEFAKSILDFDQKFDLIIVDSVKRNECIKECIAKLSSSGIVILDNSERDNYKKSFDFMKDAGFLEITFTGVKPLSTKFSSTTIFYKEGNIFNI